MVAVPEAEVPEAAAEAFKEMLDALRKRFCT